MYIDEKVLKIIYKAKDDKQVEQILDDYNDKVSELTFKVYLKYFKDDSIDKPALKGIKELDDLDVENLDPNNKEDKDKILRTISRGFMAASTTPEFQKMYFQAISKFNEFLINDSIDALDDDELNELIDHIEEVKTRQTKNKDLVMSVLEQYKNLTTN